MPSLNTDDLSIYSGEKINMEDLLDRIQSLCQDNSVIMHIWHEGRCISMAEFKFLLNTPAEICIFLYLPARVGSEWDDKIDILDHIWTISISMLINPRFQAEFEHEFFLRLLHKTF